MSQLISRRTFLHGAGTMMALPLLEGMLPVSALAQTAKKHPVRMAFVFIPNGANMQDWTPEAEGTTFELPYILQPLQPVKNSVMVMTGLTQDKARPNGDGAGDHARSASSWLTGCQARKTSGSDIHVGVSADQLAAQFVGSQTRFPSLEIGVERGAQAGNCDSGYSCAYSSCVSWRSPTTPVAKEIDPRLVFERLFSNGDVEETEEARGRRLRYNKSILDFVLEDANALKAKLGARDKDKLDEYLVSVREIETRLTAAETANVASKAGVGKPSGIPSDPGEHIRLMGDMMVLAFQGDLTRICTFMIANEGSNRPYRNINVAEGHHDLSHHAGDPVKKTKIRDINRFHMEQVAYVVKKMATIKEGDSTLLDNTMLVYGGGIGDGNRHNHDDLPVVLIGKGGGTIQTGRHVKYARNTPMNNLYLSMLDRMKVRAENIGDSTGRLNGLI